MKGKWKPVLTATCELPAITGVRETGRRLASPHTPGDTDISDRRPITEVIELRQSKEDS